MSVTAQVVTVLSCVISPTRSATSRYRTCNRSYRARCSPPTTSPTTPGGSSSRRGSNKQTNQIDRYVFYICIVLFLHCDKSRSPFYAPPPFTRNTKGFRYSYTPSCWFRAHAQFFARPALQFAKLVKHTKNKKGRKKGRREGERSGFIFALSLLSSSLFCPLSRPSSCTASWLRHVGGNF